MNERGETGAGGPFSRPVRLTRLRRSGPHVFAEAPDAGELAALADALDARAVSKMRFTGRLVPVEEDGWRLEAHLGASVVQSCVVTLAPVKTRIDVEVRRLYLPERAVQAAEIEIDPEDEDEIDPLPQALDLGAVATEALVLALPAYPRAKGAALDPGQAGDAGEADRREKPFAALAALRGRVDDGDG